MATPRKADPQRGGRPTVYRADHAKRVYRLALLGLVDEDLALAFGISKATLNTWKRRHPEFLDSITRGKIEADSEVAHSLFRRANGWEHQAAKFFYQPAIARVVKGEDGQERLETERGHVVTKRYIERYPGDTKAASVWLFNRQRKLWRNHVEIEHAPRQPFDGLSDAELVERFLESRAAKDAASAPAAGRKNEPEKLH